ncbi:LysR family transcriptional regulator [Levilactobacillus tujiorum]|uniref:LysR family transcriptional regulator n=1 Tax=Levilactobacillus tujiorum TaxID=2912243 RepID=A0ABX1L6F3_9LACO|nr:LysR family transcriptional regulator [Levilactobacillus tujiorum]MCH5465538.1 LysR family transcriptional regulator [Levilactobacillus tujiorum]NLR12726.1 LysR family transcriptional regulator [Lactobacillus sp. HBUAS51387]NLR30641.1 LysR family transcriptional regulator [Levilactobacillus tujiorum]
MNTKDLAYFNRLIKLKNFSQVAAEFGVTQPTITTAIKRLETEFATKLFLRDRVHHDLTITASGEQLAVHATEILRRLDLAHQEINRLTQRRTVLGLPPIIENHYFPRVAAHLQAQGMLENIETIEGGSIWLRNALRDGQVDLALLGSTEPLAYQTLVAEEFDRKPFNIFVSARHPLAKRKRIYFSELRHEKFVLFNNSFIHDTAFNQLARRNHFRPDVVFRARDTHIIMNLVAENVGVTYLTGLVDQRRSDVVRLDLLDDEQPEFISSIAYLTSHVLTPTQAQVLAVLRGTLEE